ncbi:MAG: hypothetical protein LBT13_11625 [Treponema sp.]|nr:hypothetical protein [Treponema sp.]
MSVIEDSIAYTICGLQPGTIITKINGKPVKEISRNELLDPSFYRTVDEYTILEDGNERTLVSPLKGR